jgi:hypothetical protein
MPRFMDRDQLVTTLLTSGVHRGAAP